MVKAYNLNINYVLYEMSYINIIMYSATLPTYHSSNRKKEQGKGTTIKADDPRNRDKVARMIEQFK